MVEIIQGQTEYPEGKHKIKQPLSQIRLMDVVSEIIKLKIRIVKLEDKVNNSLSQISDKTRRKVA